MADWLVPEIGLRSTLVSADPLTGFTVTAGAVNVKGAWAQISASTPQDSEAVSLEITAKSTTSADYLIDIGYGAAGSEQVVVPNILLSAGSSSSHIRCFWFPLHVSGGQRLAVRCQSSTASATIGVAMTLQQETFNLFPSFDRFVTLGAVTSTSGGTVLSNPAAAGWGAWTSLGTTPEHLAWVCPIFGDNKVATRTAGQIWVSQASYGASGSERILTPPLYNASSSTSLGMNFYPGWWMRVPNGQQVNMRYGSSATTTLGAAGVLIGGVR